MSRELIFVELCPGDYDGLPFATRNTFIPIDAFGGININSQLSFLRTHILGADMATSIGGFSLGGSGSFYS
ncbi:MAG: hypothetical protein R2764_25495 [Bacteroidales bacterium]